MNISPNNASCFFRAFPNFYPNLILDCCFASFSSVSSSSIPCLSSSFARRYQKFRRSLRFRLFTLLLCRLSFFFCFFVFFFLFSFISILRLSPLSIPYRWLNARCDEREPNIAFPKDHALSPLFHFIRSSSRYQQRSHCILPVYSSFTCPFLFHTHAYAPTSPSRSLGSNRSAHTFPRKFSSISLASTSILSHSTSCAPVSLSPCIHHPFAHLIHPTLQAVSSVKIPLVCSPSRGSSLPRLRSGFSSPSHPFLPLSRPLIFLCSPCLAREMFFVRGSLYVAQQRLRKGPLFSSEGVSPRGNCAIVTSAPWNLPPPPFPTSYFRLPCALYLDYRFLVSVRSFSRRSFDSNSTVPWVNRLVRVTKRAAQAYRGC